MKHLEVMAAPCVISPADAGSIASAHPNDLLQGASVEVSAAPRHLPDQRHASAANRGQGLGFGATSHANEPSEDRAQVA
jgi:hypothetical protein